MLHIMGDTDGILSTHGLNKWIRSTGWKATKPYKPWLETNLDFIGYTKQYGNLTIATIHGEGHSAVLTRVDKSG
jgi:hypothetical protein